MHNDDDDFEPVVSRLRSVRQQPLDHALAQRVLARAHRSRLTWLRATKLKVAAALAAGFMIGSVSLASAGALPGSAQDVAHAALGALGVDVPPGHDRYNGPECGDVATHGEYVDAHPDDPAAAKSPCGKPNRSVDHPHKKGTDPAGAPGDVKSPGPPPWAGQGKGNDKDKDKDESEDKDESKEDSPTPELPTVTTVTVAEAPSTTTVAEAPSTTTAPSEPTVTTGGTSDSDTSTTTSTVATTAP